MSVTLPYTDSHTIHIIFVSIHIIYDSYFVIFRFDSYYIRFIFRYILFRFILYTIHISLYFVSIHILYDSYYYRYRFIITFTLFSCGGLMNNTHQIPWGQQCRFLWWPPDSGPWKQCPWQCRRKQRRPTAPRPPVPRSWPCGWALPRCWPRGTPPKWPPSAEARPCY